MKIINQHLGLPVICLDTSEKVGDVIRFVTDQVAGRIVAVAVSRKWYQEPSAVTFSECTAFGQNVVLIKSIDALKPLSQMPDIGLHLEAATDSRQRTAITESGRLLGTVTDEAFDERSGEVTGYRLDILAEAGTGRTVFIGHDGFVTASATVAILKEDVLNSASDVLTPRPESTSAVERPPVEPIVTPEPEPAPQPAPDDPEANSTVEPPAVLSIPASLLNLQEEVLAEEEQEEEAVDAVNQEVRDQQEGHNRVMMALVIGKTAGASLTDASGAVIAENGAPITMEIAQAAADAHKLYELWTNARD